MSDAWTRIYRRDGTPYPEGDAGVLEWAKDMENRDLRIVKQDALPDGSFVSTIWLGLDHSRRYSGEPHIPLIFETMVWDRKGEIVDTVRYPTENAAICGHLEALDRHRARITAENS